MIDCTVLIMTYNEEANIEKCLNSVIGKFSRICLVDSFSSDGTLKVTKKFKNVEIFNNQFLTFGDQRNWLLENAKVKTSFVLFLDADEVVPDGLFKEISSVIENDEVDFATFPVVNFFLGKAIRFAYGHPDVIRLFRVSSFEGYVTEGARDYPIKKGREVKLKSFLKHEDLKPFEVWLSKHIVNAQRETGYDSSHNKGRYDQGIKTFIRENVWSKLPISVRPTLYFSYRYLLKGGFLDGFPGFVFCFFQALSYQTMISVYLYIDKSKR